MGSVKKLIHIVPPDAKSDKPGVGVFDFSDRYSIKDYGAMPDLIPFRGKVLAMMGGFNFELLSKFNPEIPHHYLGMVDVSESDVETLTEDGLKETLIGSLQKQSNLMAVRTVSVFRPQFGTRRGEPGYDYNGFLAAKKRNFVVPVEAIYRNGAPVGSSIFRRLEKANRGDKSEKKYIDDVVKRSGLGSIDKLVPGVVFPQTVYDFTTKFELADRPLTDTQAQHISGLTQEQFDQLLRYRQSAAEFIGAYSESRGFADWDGKLEFAVIDGIVTVVDVFGTFDENRFSYKGEPVSKEPLRQWYDHNQPEFVKAVKEAKEAHEISISSACKVPPKNLPAEMIALKTDMFTAGFNQYTGKKPPIFETDSLSDVILRLRASRESGYKLFT